MLADVFVGSHAAPQLVDLDAGCFATMCICTVDNHRSAAYVQTGTRTSHHCAHSDGDKDLIVFCDDCNFGVRYYENTGAAVYFPHA